MASPTELSLEARRLNAEAHHHRMLLKFLEEAGEQGADERKVTAAMFREWRIIEAVEERLESIRTEALRELTT